MNPLETAILAAHQAGDVLARAYGGPHEITVKGPRDITTEADLEAERVSVEAIRDHWPTHRIVSEESYRASAGDADVPTWYIDPLDGTTNYARGLPGFSVSVAMAVGGVVQCGAVFDPMLDQLFWAQRGGGAYLNGKPLQVSGIRTLHESVVLLDWPRDQQLRQVSADFLARLAPKVDTVRSRGSAALGICAVAAGWADAYYQYTLSAWDVAAGLVILQEAGGKATDLRGNPPVLAQPDWLASNGLVHDAIVDMRPLR